MFKSNIGKKVPLGTKVKVVITPFTCGRRCQLHSCYGQIGTVDTGYGEGVMFKFDDLNFGHRYCSCIMAEHVQRVMSKELL